MFLVRLAGRLAGQDVVGDLRSLAPLTPSPLPPMLRRVIVFYFIANKIKPGSDGTSSQKLGRRSENAAFRLFLYRGLHVAVLDGTSTDR